MEFGLSLGSNLGDRLGNLTRARREIAALPSAAVLASSRVYQTEPVGADPRYRQLAFLNAFLAVESGFPPNLLASRLSRIEADMGRVRTADRNAPRPIDIDIVYADGLQIHERSLILPHPRWADRRFVVQPMADVRPDLVLPPEARTVAQILCALPATPEVVLFGSDW